MRSHLAFLTLLIAPALFSGCLDYHASYESPEAPVSTEPEPAPSRASPAPSATEPSKAATKPADETAARETERAPEARRLERTTRTITLDGRTPTRYCIGSLDLGCRTLQAGHNTSVILNQLPVPETLTGTLSWNGSTPAHGRMHVTVVKVGAKEPYYGSYGRWIATGTSPLHISFNVPQYREVPLMLVVHNMDCLLGKAPAANCALDGSANYSLAQEFVFQGELSGWNWTS